ncbi:MAG: hypothetical protein FJ319_13820 [SAR202 cluster bacterium]|nr:hypothetical protein [SAR202 cluster bacterium]
MRVISSGYMHDSRGAPFPKRSAAFTDIFLASNGELLASFRLGSERESLDGHEVVYASSDGGKTWSLRWDGFEKGMWADGTPGEIKTFSIAELTPGVLTATGLWVDRTDPSLPYVSPRTQGILPMRIYHSVSRDGGRTWTGRKRMKTDPHVGASPNTHAILKLANGVLAQPYEHWKEYDDESQAKQGTELRLSHDFGRTWPEYVTVAAHPKQALYYWDVRYAQHPGTGQLAAMYWTHDSAKQQDVDSHISWGTPDGREWTTPVATGLPGQHTQPIALGGDRLAAVYPVRRGPRPGIAMSLSRDFGKTWDRSHDLAVYDSADGEEAGAKGPRPQKELWDDMIAWRFGHPRGVLLPDGTVLVVFYAGDNTFKSARWARVDVGS